MKWKSLIVMVGLAILTLIWLPAFSQTGSTTVSSQETLQGQRDIILSMIDGACDIWHEWLDSWDEEDQALRNYYDALTAATEAESHGPVKLTTLTALRGLMDSVLEKMRKMENIAIQMSNKITDIETAFTSLVKDHYSTSEEYKDALNALVKAVETWRTAPHHTCVEVFAEALEGCLKALQGDNRAWRYYTSNYTKFQSLWSSADHWWALANSRLSNADAMLNENDKAFDTLTEALKEVRDLLCRLPEPAEAFLKGLKTFWEGVPAPQGGENSPLDPDVVQFLKSRQETLEQATEDWERIKEQYPFGVSDPLSFDQIIRDYFIPTPEEFREDLQLLAFVIGTATAWAHPTPVALAEWGIEFATKFGAPDIYDKIQNKILDPIVSVYTCIYNGVRDNASLGSSTTNACVDINCGKCDFSR